jgi:hypothetical protein
LARLCREGGNALQGADPWNEPNIKEFYTGSIPQMVELASIAYTTLKHIDPTVLVCSPSATGDGGVNWLDQYLQAGGAKYADVIGYHFYVSPEPPEKMVPMIQRVKAVMERNGIPDKQLWNTEAGWAIQNSQSVVRLSGGTSFNKIVLPNEQASAYLARAFLLNWAEGVSRLYWYAWDDKVMGLTEADGKTIKPPAQAYSEIENWLIGARIKFCGRDQAGTWTCEIARDRGYLGRIVWNPERLLDFHVPGDWHARGVRELSGKARKFQEGQIVPVGPMPILVENATS